MIKKIIRYILNLFNPYEDDKHKEERLYEYEDTGLTPEQIVKLQEQNAILKELLRLTAKDAKRLFNA